MEDCHSVTETVPDVPTKLSTPLLLPEQMEILLVTLPPKLVPVNSSAPISGVARVLVSSSISLSITGVKICTPLLSILSVLI